MAYQFPLNGGRINASVGGNSTSAGAGYQLVSTGTLLLAGGNNITLSQNGQSISIVGGAGGGGAGLSAGTQSVNTGTVNFANSNGITFGMSGSNQITASHNGITSQTAQTIGGYASGNSTGQSSSSTFDARSFSISAAGGLSAGFSSSALQLSAPAASSLSGTGGISISRNGNTISIGNLAFSAGMSTLGNTAGTTGTVSNQLIFAGGNNITLSQSTGAGGNTITISAGAGGGGAALSAGTQSVSTGTVAFANSNNITFGMSGSNQITASYSQSVQTQSNIQGIVASGSTNRTGDISFANSNGVTFGLSNNTVTASVAGASAGIAGLANSQTTYTSGTVRLVEGSGAITINSSVNGASQSYRFNVPATSSISATGAFSISTNGSTVSMGVPAFSAGISSNSTVTNQLILAAGNNITLSQSTNATGATISIAGGAGGGGGGVALYDGANSISSGTARITAGGALTASVNGQTLSLNAPAVSSLTGTNGIGLSSNGSTISVGLTTLSTYVNLWPASTASVTLGGAIGSGSGTAQFFPVSVTNPIAFNALRVLMQMSFATSTTSGAQTITQSYGLYSNNAGTLSLISSNTLGYSATVSSVSATLSAPSATGTDGYTYGSTSASTTAQIHSLFGTVNPRMIDLQFGNTMSLNPGVYWLGVVKKEASANAAAGLSLAMAGNVMPGFSPVGLSSAALSSNSTIRGPHYLGFGPYNAATGAIPGSAAISSINHTGTVMPLMTFIST